MTTPTPLRPVLRDWRRLTTIALADGARPRTEVLWLNPACVRALDGAAGPMFAGLRA